MFKDSILPFRGLHKLFEHADLNFQACLYNKTMYYLGYSVDLLEKYIN